MNRAATAARASSPPPPAGGALSFPTGFRGDSRGARIHVMREALVLAGVLAACASEREPRVAPERGSQAGGDAIRIEGYGFVGRGAPMVYVGDRAAKAVVVQSNWLITVLTPQAAAPGLVDITILFEDGEAMKIPGAFTYEARQGIVLQPEIGGG